MKLRNVLMFGICVMTSVLQAMEADYAQQVLKAVQKGSEEFKRVVEHIPQDFKAGGTDKKLLVSDIAYYLRDDQYIEQIYHLLQCRLFAASAEELLGAIFKVYVDVGDRKNFALFKAVVKYLTYVPAADTEHRKTQLRVIAEYAVDRGEYDILELIFEEKSADVLVDMPDEPLESARTTKWTVLYWLNMLLMHSPSYPTAPVFIKENASRTKMEYLHCLTLLFKRAYAIDRYTAAKFFSYCLPKGDTQNAIQMLMPLISVVVEKFKYNGSYYKVDQQVVVPAAWYQYAPSKIFPLLIKVLPEQEIERGLFITLKRQNKADRVFITRLLLSALVDNDELLTSNTPVTYVSEKDEGQYDLQKEGAALVENFFDEILTALTSGDVTFVALYLRKFPMLASQTKMVDGVAMTPLAYMKYIHTKMKVNLDAGIKIVQLLLGQEGMQEQLAQQIRETFNAAIPQRTADPLVQATKKSGEKDSKGVGTTSEAPVQDVAQAQARTWKEWCEKTKSVVAKKTICYAVLRTAAATAAAKRAYNQWKYAKQQARSYKPLVQIKNGTQKNIIFSGHYMDMSSIQPFVSNPNHLSINALGNINTLSFQIEGDELPLPVIDMQKYKKARQASYADLSITIRPANRFERWWYRSPYTYSARWITPINRSKLSKQLQQS